MKIILLPGLDGTGDLFSFLLPHIRDLYTQVIPLSQVANQDYQSQAQLIAKQLPREPFMLIAESYSGKLAFELSKNKSLPIKHIIFLASFLKPPSLLAKFSFLAPVSALKNKRVPNSLLGRVLFGQFNNPELLTAFYSSINQVSNSVIKARLKNIRHMKNPKGFIDIPVSYLHASQDSLVPYQNRELFSKHFKEVAYLTIEGSHFIAQTNPKHCAQVIRDTVNRYNHTYPIDSPS